MKARFGELFGKARRERGVTLRQVKDLFGGVPSYWSEIETGRRLPPKDNELLKRMAKLFGIDEEKFIQAAQADRVRKDTTVMEKLFNADPDLAWGFYRAMEDRTSDEFPRKEFDHFLAALKKDK